MLTLTNQALTVGSITDPTALRANFSSQDCDLIELRLDSLGSGSEVLDFMDRHHQSLPFLITARDPHEGGLCERSLSERLSLLEAALPFANFIDVELANLDVYQDIITQAKATNVSLVLSSHDFKGFDHIATMERITEAQAAGAQITKAAVTLNGSVDFSLFESLVASMEGSFSIMGMGLHGPASRLLAAQHGSLLNYGYLGEHPTAPGQWPACLLKEAIAATPRFS